MRSPEAPGRAWQAQGVLVVGAALFALVFHLRLPGRLPGEDDHARAGAHLAAHARPGDVLLLSPWWTERARLFAPPELPVVGYLGSDGDPLRRHPRIWVLAQPRLPKSDDAAFLEAFGPGRRQVGEPVWFGVLRLTLYENGRHRPARFSAAEAVARGEAEVFLEQPEGRRQSCPRAGDAYRCPGGAHLYVRTEWHEVLYEPRRCVYAHPPGGSARLVISLPAAQLGEDALFEAGILWEHAAKKAGITPTSVRLEHAETGSLLADLTLAPGREGFSQSSVPAASTLQSGPSPLRITVHSQNADARQVCLELTAFGAPERGG